MIDYSSYEGYYLGQLIPFVNESNRIEGIKRDYLPREFDAHLRLLDCERITVADMEAFVADVAGRPLRRHPNQNVRVGDHIAPRGGPEIESQLSALLEAIADDLVTPWEGHRRYEYLHPFIDGNGRSGRALWAWHMRRVGRDPFALPFLHRWYYDTLSEARR